VTVSDATHSPGQDSDSEHGSDIDDFIDDSDADYIVVPRKASNISRSSRYIDLESIESRQTRWDQS
jgi:hypothetical protein